MKQSITLFKALSDETRLRILLLLKKDAMCVCELTDMLNLSQPKISKHLTKLKDLGFIDSFRQGRYMVYRLSDDAFFNAVLDQTQRELQNDEIIVNDHNRIRSCRIQDKQA